MNDQRLRICYAVSGRNEGGGIERHVADLANGLSQECEIYVLAHESLKPLFGNRVIFQSIRFDRWRYNPLLLGEFTMRVRAIDASIVHAHGRKAARVVSLTRQYHEAKSVLTVHNLNIHPRSYATFDSVICVSTEVAARVDHPRSFTVFNGC